VREHCVSGGGVRDGRERGELTLIGCAPVKGRLDVGAWGMFHFDISYTSVSVSVFFRCS